MPDEGPVTPREFGFYIALGQVGLEMVIPVVIGLALDHYLNWKPWGVIVGAAIGLFGGLAHLIALANQHERSKSSKDRRDAS
jgi:F0F1-type ATP synthase assembly protein I